MPIFTHQKCDVVLIAMSTELLELRQQFEEGRKRLAALKVGGDMMQPGCMFTSTPHLQAVLTNKYCCSIQWAGS